MQPEDKLFATLDVTAHPGKLPSGMTVLFIDTVGFVSDLPPELVESFSATLEDISDSVGWAFFSVNAMCFVYTLSQVFWNSSGVSLHYKRAIWPCELVQVSVAWWSHEYCSTPPLPLPLDKMLVHCCLPTPPQTQHFAFSLPSKSLPVSLYTLGWKDEIRVMHLALDLNKRTMRKVILYLLV